MERFSLSKEIYESIARKLIQTFRPTMGKKRTVHFYNWETRAEEEIQFSYIRDNDFKEGVQYYALDEDGLELLFATREFYSEFQLSIHQLMLRKQLEKGEFKGALRQINEMRIDVETLYERITKIELEIKRNIVSDETFARYETLLNDIYGRLTRENDEFDELADFVTETRNHLYYQDNDKKERKAYTLLLKISKELELVHAEHGGLLNKSVHLKQTALKAAQESLYYAGVDSFNFQQDITARMLNSPAAVETMKGMVAPFLGIEQTKVWSMLSLFEKQVVTNQDNEQEKQTTFLGLENEDEEQLYVSYQREIYQKYMTLLMEWYESNEVRELTSFLSFLRTEGQADVLHERMFYEFFLVLHQRSPLVQDQSFDEQSQAQYVLTEVMEILGGKTLYVEELPDLLQVTERYSIQNMLIRLEE
ncbi:hypothetical protein JCM9140_1358 [Halalkalibacter wakoensis JCM 9140]|uniref:Uncharacterized protein n=1 Tax=Halalkalibacter wakoensis JCM 9140 TaxID=1236970 RepID=W4Q041_9BACI|nr:replicative DNA helicase [Halalkalibacter wakoensis]GAE25367.1 hypothetical protein JCM9140_1358 [Halalkalibacter wakoensis JCM 9140]